MTQQIPDYDKFRWENNDLIEVSRPNTITSDAFKEEQHPRDPKGMSTGGQFTSKGGAASIMSETDKILQKPTKGTTAERVAARKALKTETDPEKRKALQKKVLDSFQLQYDKTADPEYLAKYNKYAAMYKLGVSKTEMKPSISIPVTVHAPEPQTTPQFTPEEVAVYSELSALADPEQAKSWMRIAKIRLSKEGTAPLNLGDVARIKAYTGSGYKNVNTALRKNSAARNTYEHQLNLTRALEKLPPYEGISYRKTNLTTDQMSLYIPGHVVHERGFTSTSLNEGTWNGTHRYVIKGKSGRNIQHLSSHPGEAEVLFKANTPFVVTKVVGNVIHMEEL